MKPMNEQQLINLEGGKFWGKSCGPAYSLEEGTCFQNCSYYVFWINTGTEQVPCEI